MGEVAGSSPAWSTFLLYMNRQIIIKGTLVSYAEHGPEGSPAVVFLHGWRSNKEAWNGMVTRLTASQNNQSGSRRLIAIDLPGFGASEAPKSAYSVSDYAEIVAEFISKLTLTSVSLIGHSFGGRVAIKLAAQKPKLIQKLILIDSGGFRDESSKKNILKAGAKIVKPFFAHSFMRPLRAKIYKSIGAEDYVATPVIQETFMKVIGEDLTEDIQKISAPTLLIWGAKDAETPPSFGTRMNKLIAGSKLSVIAGAGHFSFIDKPDETAKLVGDFLTA